MLQHRFLSHVATTIITPRYPLRVGVAAGRRRNVSSYYHRQQTSFKKEEWVNNNNNKEVTRIGGGGGGSWSATRMLSSLSSHETSHVVENSVIHSEPWRKNLRGGTENQALVGRRDPAKWYTGMLPTLTPGFDKKAGVLRSLPIPRLSAVTLADAEAYFDNTWTTSELLFSSMQGEEAFYRHPDHRLRHPLVFYLNHTAVFYINKFVVAGLLPKSIDKNFESMFEIGVDEMRWDDMSKGDKSWPKISEIMSYRRQVYRTVKDVLRANLNQNPKTVTWDDPMWTFFMACDHDRIHLETSSQLMREMPLEFLLRPQHWPAPADPTPIATPAEYNNNYLVSMPGPTTVTLGKPRHFDTFGWDNEYGMAKINVPEFKVTRDHVTNGEFLAFVKDGGYIDKSVWSEDGWSWRRFRNVLNPHFWVRDGPAGSHKYALRTLFDVLTPMPMDWPAIVNYYEAQAFCNWKSRALPNDIVRLMTEAEFGVVSPIPGSEEDVATKYDGANIENKTGYNFALANGSERSVARFPPDERGIRNARGNVWSWCQEPITPLPGFQVHPYYVDFTEPCFDDLHYLIMGGSYISSGNAGTGRFNRYHFRAHFLQQAGFRYVVTPKPKVVAGTTDKQPNQNDYLDPKVVEQYVGFHFGQSSLQFANATVFPHAERPDEALNFVARCAKLVDEACGLYEVDKGTVLDVGCAVGGTSWEFSRIGFKHVLGIDYSTAFVQQAREILKTGRIKCYGVDAELPPLPANSKIEFQFGDAMNLDSFPQTDFDVVFAGNLLCRLPDPRKFLRQLPRMVKPGGLVVLVSPFSWLESFTPKSNWLDWEPGRGEARVAEEMKKLGFDLVYYQEMPFMIRETVRKYQYVVSHAQVFCKVGRD